MLSATPISVKNVSETEYRATPQLPSAVRQLQTYTNSCWDFFQECVYTQDQADKDIPVKKYPDKEYLKYVTGKIVNETLLAMVKTRRMIITWTGCGVMLWDAMFHEGRLNSIISKKETDSDELVRRCKFMYENIPPDKLELKPRMDYKYCSMTFPEINSQIIGIAQGPDQLRQYTCSRILADEMGFWPFAKETFVAMKPTLDGGGQVFIVSTRAPGFFKELIEDNLDDDKEDEHYA